MGALKAKVAAEVLRDRVVPELRDTLDCLQEAGSRVELVELARIEDASDRLRVIGSNGARRGAQLLALVVGDLKDPTRGIALARIRLGAFLDGLGAGLEVA